MANKLRHLAFIMDGNGRWGQAQKQNRLFGHKQGAEKVREVIEHCLFLGIAYITIYAFSTENWHRKDWEVNGLMNLLKLFSRKEIKAFQRAGVRVRFIGRRDRLPVDLVAAMELMEKATAGGHKMLLQIAVDYGGRDELVRVFNDLRNCGRDLTESDVCEALDTRLAPDPDLIIRTGGHSRLSNFMLWQAAYAEIRSTDTPWPAFTTDEVDEIIHGYVHELRNFGSVKEAAE